MLNQMSCMLRQKLLVIMSAKGACYHVCYILTKSHQSYMLQDVSINAGCACTGLAVPHHNLGIQVVHGPLSIAIGLGAGVVLGFVCALTPVWSSPLRRAVALLTFGELLAFCGYVLFCSRLRSLARSLTHSLTGVQCDLEFSSSWVCGHSGHGRPVQPGMAQVEPIPAVQPSCSRSVDPSHTCTIGIAKACKCIQVGRCNM